MSRPPAPASASPCRGVQEQAASKCAEAERLAGEAGQRADQLRAARRRRAELDWASRTDNQMADRRRLREAKVDAQRAYHEQSGVARDATSVALAAAKWMDEISRLNREARQATSRQALFNHQAAALDALVRRLELEVDATRIAASSARERCLEARRSLAACEEANVRQRAAHAPPPPPLGRAAYLGDGITRGVVATASPGAAASAQLGVASLRQAPVSAPDNGSHEPAVVGLLRGDRHMLQAVVSRLAEEMGHDAGRLQLLMLELREAIIDVARQACAFDFVPRHPFWSQFSRAEARAVAAALATLGRGFDGRGGWAGGTPAHARELAMAISLSGRDPRSIRRPPTPAELEALWQGTTIAAAEHLLSVAPDLRLDAIVALVGRRAEALTELWDNWGRLRPLLLGTDPSLSS